MKPFLLTATIWVLSVGAVLASTLALADPVFTVNSVFDQIDDNPSDGVCHTAAGTCTLRAAVMEANQTVVGADVAILVPAGTFTLTLAPVGANGDDVGDLNLMSGDLRITISGAGPALTIIDANQTDRAFHIAFGRTAVIAGMTVRNGNHGSYGTGGAIYNEGVLTLSNDIVRDSHANAGGGIANLGQMEIDHSTVMDNTAQDQVGGGIYSSSLSHLTVLQSTINGNASTGMEGNAGGIYSGGVGDIIDSTVSENRADHDGGGIYNDGAMSLYNSSIISNQAQHGPSATGTGAGIYAHAGRTFALRNSLVAGNYLPGQGQPVYDDCAGTVVAHATNLFWMAPDCMVTGPGSVDTLNSLQTIGPLLDNGGPTETHALLSGSNAIDGATQGDCVDENGDTLATDQRDQPRISGVRCDIGSFEFSDMIFANGFDHLDR